MQTFDLWLRARDMPLLKGEQVQLLPYAPDVMPDDFLWYAWQRFRDDGTLPRLFWQQPTATSFKDFVLYWEHRAAIFFVATHEPRILGMVWLSDVVRWHRAEIGIGMYRHVRRDGIAWQPQMTREAVWLLLEWATQAQKLTRFWIRTPWREASRLARACGATKSGVLPGYHLWQGRTYDVELWTLHRDKDA